MKNKIFTQLENEYLEFKILENEITQCTAELDFIDMNKKYYSFKKKLSDFIIYKNILKEIEEIKDLSKNDKDIELKNLIENELTILNEKKKKIELKISNINEKIEKDHVNNLFFEIRAASGGNESSIFVKDLFKMYSNYFDNKKWKYEILSCSYSNINGYKEIIIKVSGDNIFNKLKNESGIHRVQRIPQTESNGRVHTSTCTVAVLKETEQIESININVNDLRIDTYRASGAGGQHVNMTDSAVRITHIPTGLVAECQNERSQHKNKSTALSLLKSRILNIKNNEIKNEIASERKNLIGTGARSEKIRTYNFVQNRITDHRINATIHRLADVLNGNLDLIIKNY